MGWIPEHTEKPLKCGNFPVHRKYWWMFPSADFGLESGPMKEVVEEIGKVPPRPLNSGEVVCLFRFLWVSRSLTCEQMFPFV